MTELTSRAPVLREALTSTAGGVPRYELLGWRERFGVTAGITGRGEAGTPQGPFNLGLFTDDGAAAVMRRWESFQRAIGPAFPGAVVSRQCHGSLVATHHAPITGCLIRHGYDGHLTDHPGTLLIVTVADCIPVYLVAPMAGTLALLHAGWRGTAAGILEAGLARLGETASCGADEIVMHLGIGICGQCYEVGPEVPAALHLAAGDSQRVDLRGVLAERAWRVGVREITTSDWCTRHAGERFCSHRREGHEAGRMAAYLGRPVA